MRVLTAPVELLGYIIEICARAEPPKPVQTPAGPRAIIHRRPGTSGSGWLGWLRIGHVCAYLRQVVLEMPALWATVAFTLPKGHAEIMARARDAPLVIDLRMEGSPPESLLRTTETHFLTAKTIRIKGEPDRPSLGFGLQTKDFATLEELELSGWNLEQDVTKDTISLAPLRAPHLRHLKLHNRFLPFDLSTLQTLVLKYHDSRHSSGPPWRVHGPVLLELLSRCTRLQRLVLGGIQFDDLPAPSSNRAAVPLPHLKYIGMIGSVAFCRSVRSNLILDPFTCVEATLVSSYSWNDNVAEIQAALADEDAFIIALLRRFNVTGGPSVTGVRLDARDQDLRIALAINDVGASTIECQGPFKDRAFALDVCTRRHGRDHRAALFVRLLTDLPNHVELSGVNALVLSLPRENAITLGDWTSLLSPFHSVRDLVYDEFPPQRAFWDALCPTPDVALALPNLRALFILPDEPQSTYESNATPVEHLVPWEDIPRGLHRRAERDARIERMVLGTYWDMRNVVGTENMQTLRSAVHEVVDTRQYIDGRLVLPGFR